MTISERAQQKMLAIVLGDQQGRRKELTSTTCPLTFAAANHGTTPPMNKMRFLKIKEREKEKKKDE